MPADNDIQVFDFEGNFEESFYNFLLDNGIELATFNNPQRLGDDYIAINFNVTGLHEDEHMSQKPDGELEYDHYNFEVEITVHTDRHNDNSPGLTFSKYHREIIAKVRNLLSISRAAKVGSLNEAIEYYWVNRLIPRSTICNTDDNSKDESLLIYEGDFSILTSSWASI